MNDWLTDLITLQGGQKPAKVLMEDAEELVQHWVAAFPEIFKGRTPAAVLPKEQTYVYDVDLQIALSLLGMEKKTQQQVVARSIDVIRNATARHITSVMATENALLLASALTMFDLRRVLSLWGRLYTGTRVIMQHQIYRVWFEQRAPDLWVESIQRRLIHGILHPSLDPHSRALALDADIAARPHTRNDIGMLDDPEADASILDAMRAVEGTDVRGGLLVWFDLMHTLATRLRVPSKPQAFDTAGALRSGHQEHPAEVAAALRDYAETQQPETPPQQDPDQQCPLDDTTGPAPARPAPSLAPAKAKRSADTVPHDEASAADSPPAESATDGPSVADAVPRDEPASLTPRETQLEAARQRAADLMASLVAVKEQTAENMARGQGKDATPARISDPAAQRIHQAIMNADARIKGVSVESPGSLRNARHASGVASILSRMRTTRLRYDTADGTTVVAERLLELTTDPIGADSRIMTDQRRDVKRTRVLLLVDVSYSMVNTHTLPFVEDLCASLTLGFRTVGARLDLVGFSDKLYWYADALPPLFRKEIVPDGTGTLTALRYAAGWAKTVHGGSHTPILLLTDGVPTDGSIEVVHSRLNDLARTIPVFYGVLAPPGKPAEFLPKIRELAARPRTGYVLEAITQAAQLPSALNRFLQTKRIL